jgi:hypothetical protein
VIASLEGCPGVPPVPPQDAFYNPICYKHVPATSKRVHVLLASFKARVVCDVKQR